MLKKVLTTALFGVSALGVAVANAAAPGVYVTGQLGYAQTHMKNKTDISALENKQFPDASIDVDGKNNLGNNGLAGRLAIGYQFNQNLAVEMGYLQLQQGKSGKITVSDKNDPQNILAQGHITLNQAAIDIAAKGIVPLANNFNLYGKVGVAYLNTTIDLKGKIKPTDQSEINGKVNLNDLANIKKSQWAPEVAIGVSYDLTQNVSIDTSWTHIHTIGKNRAGNVDFFAAGVSYNFG